MPVLTMLFALTPLCGAHHACRGSHWGKEWPPPAPRGRSRTSRAWTVAKSWASAVIPGGAR